MNSIFLAGVLLAAASAPAEPPPTLHVDANRITLSGISAGGAMASQLHFAYSELFSGVGIVAGVPFGCADGSLATAMARCMGKTDGTLPVSQWTEDIRTASEEGWLAETEQLGNDPVWLFHGTLDTLVAVQVSNAVAELYAEFIPETQIVYVNNVAAAHNFPARGNGHACDASQSPFVGNCNYDAAGEILNHMYSGLKPRSSEVTTELTTVGLPGSTQAGLSDSAYLFIPPACADGEQNCALHLVLHGCAQSAVQLGTNFIEQSGYLAWAEANNIVLAFPQVIPGPANPFACWDWWGYTGTAYRWRDGAQMIVLANWIKGLISHAD